MLQMRLEGDPAEAHAFIEALRAAGAEVLVGTTIDRREGFSHVYAVVRMPGWQPAEPAPDGPVRATVVRGRAVTGRPRRAVRRRS